MTDHNPTDWELKGVAIAGYTVALLGMSAIIHERIAMFGKIQDTHTAV